jgi:hypothetical protein
MPRLSSENPAGKELEYASSVMAHNPAIANARRRRGVQRLWAERSFEVT